MIRTILNPTSIPETAPTVRSEPVLQLPFERGSADLHALAVDEWGYVLRFSRRAVVPVLVRARHAGERVDVGRPRGLAGTRSPGSVGAAAGDRS